MEIVKPFRATFQRTAIPLAAAALFAACQSAPPRPISERAISEAVGIADAVTFQVDGGPLDAAAPDGPRLALRDALERSLRCSSELQAALARVRIALAEANQARLLSNPILNVILRLPEGGGRANFEAGVSADLLSLLQRPRKSSSADNRLRIAVAEAVSTGISVAANLQERYASVQALDELTALLRE